MSKHRRPQPHRLRRGGLVLGISAVVVVAGAGSASAYFKQSGNGKRNATIGTKAGITFTATAVINPSTTLLYPTGPKAGITFTLQPSTANYKATSMAFDSSRSVTVSSGTGTCSPSVITVDTAAMNKAVTTAGGPQTVTVASVVKLADDAPIACQGRTFTIPLIVTGVLT